MRRKKLNSWLPDFVFADELYHAHYKEPSLLKKSIQTDSIENMLLFDPGKWDGKIVISLLFINLLRMLVV